MSYNKILSLHGNDADYLLKHHCETNTKQSIRRPSGTGHISILPVDQDIENTAGASFAPNPIYFNPENIIKLALKGGSNTIASTFGALAINVLQRPLSEGVKLLNAVQDIYLTKEIDLA